MEKTKQNQQKFKNLGIFWQFCFIKFPIRLKTCVYTEKLPKVAFVNFGWHADGKTWALTASRIEEWKGWNYSKNNHFVGFDLGDF